MQQAIKTLIIFCLIMSISPTQLSFKNKGIVKFFKKLGEKASIFANKTALKIVQGFIWALRLLDYVYTGYYYVSGAHEVSESFNYTPLIFQLFFGPSYSPPLKTNALIRFILFLPATIAVGIVNLITYLTQELLEKAKKFLLETVTNYDERKKALKDYNELEAKINEASKKQTEELKKVVEKEN